jgi:hypothetical protein
MSFSNKILLILLNYLLALRRAYKRFRFYDFLRQQNTIHYYSEIEKREKFELICKETLPQVIYLSKPLSQPMTPYPPPLSHCLRVYCIHYTYAHREGGGVRDLARKKVRGTIVHKAEYQHE